MLDQTVSWLICSLKLLNYNQFSILSCKMGMINIHTPVALEGEYQNVDEVTKISNKSRVESSNTEDQSIVHKVVDSITEHKWQGYISED